jgi:hypothetical protein
MPLKKSFLMASAFLDRAQDLAAGAFGQHCGFSDTNPFGCASIAVKSRSPRAPAISVRPAASTACRATCTTATRCWPRSTGWRRWNGTGLYLFQS